VAQLEPGESARHDLKPGRYAWLQVARGAVTLNGKALGAGDGVAVSDEPAIEVTATGPAEVLLFDLA
jgi:redox-sensitive bicupin YhaK (pirin superfamily)